MVVVGLTGGIGSGKSTVATLLADRGACVIDADRIAREVVEPGRLALGAIAERFGAGVLQPDGSMDRPALASIVFNDPQALADLNAITHPAIAGEVGARLAAVGQADPGAVVVLDLPLLAEGGHSAHHLDATIVVDTPVEVAVARLVGSRGFTEADARARVAAQATREQRRAIADLVIDNSGTPEDLETEVERAWRWIMEELRHGGP